MGRLCPNAVLGCGCPPYSRGTLFETSLGLRRHCSSFPSRFLLQHSRIRRPTGTMPAKPSIRHYAEECRRGFIMDISISMPLGIVGVEILVAVAAGTNGGPLLRANHALQRLRCVLGAQTQPTLLIPSAGSAGHRPVLARFRLLKRTTSRVTRIAMWLLQFNPSGRA
jgi:hypothetical protein